MSKRPLYIACYDICDDRRLRLALRVLRNYASGGQKSVFECFLDEAERAELIAEVQAVIDPAEDRFLLLRIEPRATVHVLGIAEAPADPAYFYLG